LFNLETNFRYLRGVGHLPAGRLGARLRRHWRERRASVILEFAIAGPAFFLLLFAVFEVSYDLFLQGVLDGALALTSRQMQVDSTVNATATGSNSFTAAWFCPNSFGFLNCNNLFVRVEVISAALTNSACVDLYQSTTGDLPVANGVLDLAAYTNETGMGGGGTASPGSCDEITGAGDNGALGYCNPGPNELVLLSAIYVAPSFLNGLLPGTQAYKYNGRLVRAQFASAAFETESFTPTASRAAPC
jgi:hypothetical protein